MEAWIHLVLLVTLSAQSVLSRHPLDPLQAKEIESVRLIVSLAHPLQNYYFVTITLVEPPKFSMKLEEALLKIQRRAEAVIIFKDTGRAKEIRVNLFKKLIENEIMLPEGVQPMLGPYDFKIGSDVILKDPGVRQRLEELGLDPDLVVRRIGTTNRCAYHEPELCGKRLGFAVLYFTEFEGDNQLAHPLNFAPIVDIIAQKVIAIDELPIFANYSRTKVTSKSILVRKSTNYDPRMYPKEFFCEGIHPLRTESDGGPSFKITNGYQLDWQGFRMRLGFNAREGLVLHQISYKGRGKPRRPLIYRAALSEMTVPYGDPRPPFQYKLPFDQGGEFASVIINSLVAGVDCEHQSHLLDVYRNNEEGHAEKIKNAICISEADGGILHKHTTDRVSVARAQNLVFKFMFTIGNYDYLLKYMFHQDASIDFMVEATGQLSTNLLLSPEVPWASMVSEHVIAQYHQHLFCLRLDTEFDGETNSVSTRDVVLMDEDQELNPYGNGFTTKETLLTTSLNSVTDSIPKKNRVWKIFNPTTTNPITGSPRGYKLVPNGHPVLLAGENSHFGKRAGFATHSTWVLPYNEDELYAGGKYPNQNDDLDGVAKWVKRNESIVSKDIVVFHTLGFTHIPSTDEYPIMAVESTGISLKPCNFFDQYEGLNVPPPPEID